MSTIVYYRCVNAKNEDTDIRVIQARRLGAILRELSVPSCEKSHWGILNEKYYAGGEAIV